MKNKYEIFSSDYCPIEPQQNYFTFGRVIFSSQFDSGNLYKVIKINEHAVN